MKTLKWISGYRFITEMIFSAPSFSAAILMTVYHSEYNEYRQLVFNGENERQSLFCRVCYSHLRLPGVLLPIREGVNIYTSKNLPMFQSACPWLQKRVVCMVHVAHSAQFAVRQGSRYCGILTITPHSSIFRNKFSCPTHMKHFTEVSRM